MSFRRLLTKRCTVTTSTQDDATVDEYGNPGETTSTKNARCYFERKAADEANVDRATTDDEWDFAVLPSVALASTSSVTINGEDGTFEVVGTPWNVWNPRRAVHAQTEARLRRTQR